MLKNIKYIMFILLSFCLFSLYVDAKVYPEGYCIYNIHRDGDEVSAMIKQDSAGKFSYFFNMGSKLSSPNDSSWVADNMWITWGENKSSSWNGDYFTSCPNYAWFKGGWIPNIDFSDTEPDANDSDITGYGKVTNNSKIKKTKKDDYEGEKCPSDIDWYVKPKKDSSDDVYCLYSGYASDYGCYIVQFHYNIPSKSLEVQDASFFNWTQASGIPFNKRDSLVVDKTVLKKFSDSVGSCPTSFGVGPRKAGSTKNAIIGCTSQVGIFSILYGKTGAVDQCNPFIVSPVILKKSIPENTSIIIDTNPEPIEGGCPELIGSEMQKLLKNVVNVLRIMIPIILNVFGVIDFVKAIFANDEDKMKKAQSIFIKRLIIGVVIYLIPTVLKLILTVAHNIWPVIDNTLCGIID